MRLRTRLIVAAIALTFAAASLKSAADHLREQAKRLIAAQDDKAALRILNDCLRLDAHDDRCLAMRGEVLARQGDYDDAIADLTKAIDRRPTNAAYYFARAIAYRDHAQLIEAEGTAGSREMLTKALDDLATALPLDPNNPTQHFARGTVHFLRGDHRLAVDDFTRAIELDSRNPIYYRWRSKAYKALGMIDEAVADEAKAQ